MASVEQAAGGLTSAPDAWLAGIMRRPVLRVSGRVRPGDEHPQIAAIRGVTRGPGFVYARLPAEDALTSHVLQSAGFQVVDTGLTLETEGALPRQGPQHRARPARPEDEGAVREIARRAFQVSRFHLDPRIPGALADEIKAQWAANFFSGRRGDHMLVAEHEGRVAGFLQLLRAPPDVLVIDLIAVGVEHRGLGLGAEMIRSAAGLENVARIRVGTQSANPGSLRLYQRLGFRVVSASMVLHAHGSESA